MKLEYIEWLFCSAFIVNVGALEYIFSFAIEQAPIYPFFVGVLELLLQKLIKEKLELGCVLLDLELLIGETKCFQKLISSHLLDSNLEIIEYPLKAPYFRPRIITPDL